MGGLFNKVAGRDSWFKPVRKGGVTRPGSRAKDLLLLSSRKPEKERSPGI